MKSFLENVETTQQPGKNLATSNFFTIKINRSDQQLFALFLGIIIKFNRLQSHTGQQPNILLATSNVGSKLRKRNETNGKAEEKMQGLLFRYETGASLRYVQNSRTTQANANAEETKEHMDSHARFAVSVKSLVGKA